MKWLIEQLKNEVNHIYGMLGTTPPTSWDGTQEQWDIKEQQKAKDLNCAREILKKHLKNNEDMIENPYTAKQAKADYLAKKIKRNNFVNEKKIKEILESIKHHIQNISVHSYILAEPNIIFSGSLTLAEQSLLKDMGYDVKERETTHETEFLISW